MSEWFAASGSGNPKRIWWVGRTRGNEGSESALDKAGRLRTFATLGPAQKLTDELNRRKAHKEESYGNTGFSNKGYETRQNFDGC